MPATRTKRRPATRTKQRRPATTTAAKRARAHALLSHEKIRTAALRLIDQHGIAEFSTRMLGRELGCEAMAIYWYYPSKEALLDAVVDKLTSHLVLIARDATRDWVSVLREVAQTYRRISREHPRAFPLLATRRFASEETFGFLEELFELAHRQGIPDRTTAQFYRVVSSYCNGFALNELATQNAPNDPNAGALRKRFTRVATVSAFLEPRYLDEMFDFGLELLLEALVRTSKAEGKLR